MIELFFNNQILINNIFISWSLILILASYKNLNLWSLLVLMFIPQILDLAVITPALQLMKDKEHIAYNYKEYFFIVHALNDLFTILLIRYRFMIAIIINMKIVYRKMWQESALIKIYIASIVYNIAVFFEYKWRMYYDENQMFFYDNIEVTKLVLVSMDTIILSCLTWKTIQAVISLNKRKIIT